MKLVEAEARRRVKSCRAGDLIGELDADDRATFDRWVGEQRASFWIMSVLRDAGMVIGEKTLRSHLIGRCQCAEGNHRGAYRAAE